MLLDVPSDERAEWHNDEPLRTHVFERGLCEAVAEPVALVRLVDLGVHEDNAVVSPSVGGKAEAPASEPQLVAVRLGLFADLGLRQRGITHESGPSCAC